MTAVPKFCGVILTPLGYRADVRLVAYVFVVIAQTDAPGRLPNTFCLASIQTFIAGNSGDCVTRLLMTCIRDRETKWRGLQAKYFQTINRTVDPSMFTDHTTATRPRR